MSNNLCFSFSIDFQFSRHGPGPTVCLSLFPRFWVFLAIFQAKQCLCSIFHVFQWFLPYSMSYYVSFSFSSFDIFLAIFQVLKWVCIPFHVFQFFQHILVPVVWISHSFFSFSSFIAIFHVLQCAFLIFHPFQFFSTYSRSYSVYLILKNLKFFFAHSRFYNVHFSFFKFFSVSRPTSCL